MSSKAQIIRKPYQYIEFIRTYGFLKSFNYGKWEIIQKLGIPYIDFENRKSSRRSVTISHLGLHNSGNAGDAALIHATRRVFDKYGKYNYFWKLEDVWRNYDEIDISRLNKSDAIVIGGGGLFIKDSNPNLNSGWAFNCPVVNLKLIKHPLVLFGVGYNKFRKQEDFDDIFKTHLITLAKICGFIGIREKKGAAIIKSYLPGKLKSKVIYQPCPTTLLHYLYRRKQITKRQKRLVLNIAFDREDLRFGRKKIHMLKEVAKTTKKCSKEGWEIILVTHTEKDKLFKDFLTREKVDYELVNLTREPISEIIDFYETATLVLGMRGHSQLIPFGQRKRIISLISHNKLKWFLEDIGHKEWGIELTEKNISNKLLAKIRLIGDVRNKKIDLELAKAQKELLNITKNNVKRFEKII